MVSRKHKYYVLIILFTTLLFSCKSKSDKNISTMNTEQKIAGLGVAQTTKQASNVYDEILKTLESKDPIGIVAEIDHTKNAQGANMTLGYTRTILFGNPKLGTPLMQENIVTGLDLPQKIIVFSDTTGTAYTAYNSADYLAARHNVGGVKTLDRIKDALHGIVTKATDAVIEINTATSISYNEGIIIKKSKHDFETTYDNLKTVLKAMEPISIMAELDHQKNAKSVGLDLNPCRLIVFGNPKLGTPLMQENQTITIDLPQKILVYQEDSGAVNIAYNDPNFLVKRHHIADKKDILNKIAKALDHIAVEATQ